MSRPARTALDTLRLFLVGMALLVVVALMFYRPGGPQWPHVLVNGVGWTLVVVCSLAWAAAALDAALDLRTTRWRRRA